MNKSLRLLCLAVSLCSLSSVASAADLSIAEVAAPAVNCVFDPDCKLVVTDTVDDFPIPGATGTARLQSRTFSAQIPLPLPAFKKKAFGYLYRADMTKATTLGDASCITALAVDFGPVIRLQYDKDRPLEDIFVITKGGIGTVGLMSAVQTRNIITFTFSQPVCAADASSKGNSSFFFGLASFDPPKAITARVEVNGVEPWLSVKARAPDH